MKPLKRYISHLSFQIDKPADVITSCLQARLKKAVVANQIQIRIKPTLFDGALGRGYINIKILPGTNANNSILKAEVIPTSYTRESLYISCLVLLLFTIAFIVSASSFSVGLTDVIVWIFFAVFVHLTQQLNSGKLENYVFDLIKYLRQCKANRQYQRMPRPGSFNA